MGLCAKPQALLSISKTDSEAARHHTHHPAARTRHRNHLEAVRRIVLTDHSCRRRNLLGLDANPSAEEVGNFLALASRLDIRRADRVDRAGLVGQGKMHLSRSCLEELGRIAAVVVGAGLRSHQVCCRVFAGRTALGRTTSARRANRSLTVGAVAHRIRRVADHILADAAAAGRSFVSDVERLVGCIAH